MTDPTRTDDAVLARIGRLVMLHRGGDRTEARTRLLRLWAEIGVPGDPLHRCTLAHFLADTQDDPADALAWDLRALSAAVELSEAGTAGRPRGPVVARALYPVLHLSLAVDYAALGRADAARSHLRHARRTAEAAWRDGRDGHHTDVHAAVRRLERRLARTAPDLDDGGQPGAPDATQA